MNLTQKEAGIIYTGFFLPSKIFRKNYAACGSASVISAA